MNTTSGKDWLETGTRLQPSGWLGLAHCAPVTNEDCVVQPEPANAEGWTERMCGVDNDMISALRKGNGIGNLCNHSYRSHHLGSAWDGSLAPAL